MLALAAFPARALSAPVQAAAPYAADDWVTMGHDTARTGYQPAATGITPQSVPALALRWKVQLPNHGGMVASPLVYHGMVIAVVRGNPADPSQPPIVYALSAADGSILWQRPLEGEVRGTPAIADGRLFVGDRMFGATFDKILPAFYYALDLRTGAILWRTQLDGASRSAPVVLNGIVYTGVSGGDPPACVQGGLLALDEATGKVRWKFDVTAPHNGGSVWSPVSYADGLIYFGTGNTCTTESPLANAAIALDPSGKTEFTFQPHLPGDDFRVDDDQGGGILVSGGNIFFMNKNGVFYGLGATDGKLRFAVPLGASDQFGELSTPATDGTTLLVSAGYLNDSAASAFTDSGSRGFPRFTDAAGSTKTDPKPHGKLVALDFSGKQKWAIVMNQEMYGQAAMTGGVAFAGIDNTVSAIDVASGKILWSYAGPAYFGPSPAVVVSGVYAADAVGDVYAFALRGP